jgi:hypothetical protein
MRVGPCRTLDGFGSSVRRRTKPVIPEWPGIAAVAVFGGVDEVRHFAGGDVVEFEVVEAGEAFVEPAHRLSEEGSGIRLDPSMGVIFHKDPIGISS